jgi:hypothetical protein
MEVPKGSYSVIFSRETGEKIGENLLTTERSVGSSELSYEACDLAAVDRSRFFAVASSTQICTVRAFVDEVNFFYRVSQTSLEDLAAMMSRRMSTIIDERKPLNSC